MSVEERLRPRFLPDATMAAGLYDGFSHDYDVVIGPVADAFVDKEIERHKQKYGTRYLDTEALLDFAEHVSQFGNQYVQYCFCTNEALKLLIKE